MAFNYEFENALLIPVAVAVHELVFIPVLGVRKQNKTPACLRLHRKSHKIEGQNFDESQTLAITVLLDSRSVRNN